MKTIAPNSTIGIFGSGQLGRMFAIEASKMGYCVHTFSPDNNSPTGQVANGETAASYDDLDAVREFARSVDVITFEFENVPSATVRRQHNSLMFIQRRDPSTTQNHLRERHSLPATVFRSRLFDI